MTQAERKYLVFSLSEKLFAFDLSQVAEVSEPQQSWPVPAVPAYYRGAMNFHGSIVAVMDLATYMGFPSPGNVQEKLIVLHNDIAALAFIVERVLRIVPEHQVTFREKPEGSFATAQLALAEGVATLLDADAIAARAAEQING
jgi:purine-binding chemotaxis protein CheW